MIDFNSSLVWEIMAKTLIEISEPSHSENRRWLYKETECASWWVLLSMRNSEAAEACERGPRKRVIPQPTWEVRENQIVLSAE